MFKKIIIAMIFGIMLLTACGNTEPSENSGSQVSSGYKDESSASEDNGQAATEAKGAEIAQATSTAEAEIAKQETAAAERVVAATAQADNMAATIERLAADGKISSTDGKYYKLPDFDESKSKINWFYRWPIGFSPDNFVISADVEWDSASDKANWYNSSCGFIYNMDDSKENYYISFLSLDGNAEWRRWQKNNKGKPYKQYYGKLDVPNGSAKIMLVVDGSNHHFFVNDEHVLTRQDELFPIGELAYTLSSGINSGFGTRCIFTNVELWDLTLTDQMILYEDDFSVPESGISSGSEDVGSWGYEDGQFFVNLVEPDYARLNFIELYANDVVMEFDVKTESVDPDIKYGAICRERDIDEKGNFYLFLISGDGFYGIWAKVNDEFKNIVEWEQSDAINGAGKIDHVKVSCIGDTLSLEVNDTFLVSVIDTRLTAGNSYFYSGTNTTEATFYYDNLFIYRP